MPKNSLAISIIFSDDKADGFIIDGFDIHWRVCVSDDCGIKVSECERPRPCRTDRNRKFKCKHPVVCY